MDSANDLDSSSPPAVPAPRPIASETRAFERWRRKVGLITGLGVTEQERRLDTEEYHGQTCEKWKESLMNYS
jgi:mitochondrial inner membrane protease ATP23